MQQVNPPDNIQQPTDVNMQQVDPPDNIQQPMDANIQHPPPTLDLQLESNKQHAISTQAEVNASLLMASRSRNCANFSCLCNHAYYSCSCRFQTMGQRIQRFRGKIPHRQQKRGLQHQEPDLPQILFLLCQMVLLAKRNLRLC